MRLLVTLALLPAFMACGCYSTMCYYGDGRIFSTRWAKYMVEFEPMDVANNGRKSYTFRGAPPERMVFQIAGKPGSLDSLMNQDGVVIGMRMINSQGEVVREQEAPLGSVTWRHINERPEVSTYVLYLAHGAALKTSERYTMWVEVRGHPEERQPPLWARPGLWAGERF